MRLSSNLENYIQQSRTFLQTTQCRTYTLIVFGLGGGMSALQLSMPETYCWVGLCCFVRARCQKQGIKHTNYNALMALKKLKQSSTSHVGRISHWMYGLS